MRVMRVSESISTMTTGKSIVLLAYLDADGPKGDSDVGADVLMFGRAENGVLGRDEDVVFLAAQLAPGDRGVVHHEPVLNVCIDFRQRLALNYERK